MQDARQLDASAVDARLHRALGNSKRLLDFAIFQLLQIAQDYGFPQFRRKLDERRLNLLAELAEQREFVGAARGGLLVLHRGHGVIERIGDAIPLGAPVMVYQKITCHAR